MIKYTIAFIVFMVFGCVGNHEKDAELPDSLKEIVDAEVISLDANHPYSIELTEESIFESNEELFIEGYVRQIAIDKTGNVYLASVLSNNVHLYLFQPDGSFIKRINLTGRGPGEFEDIVSMEIWDEKLFLFGAGLQKFAVFSLGDFDLINEQIISQELLHPSDKLARSLRGFEMLVTNQGEMFIKLSRLSLQKEYELSKTLYYKVAENGTILSDRVLELKDFQLYYPDNGRFPIQMPFTRSKRVSLSGEGVFYTVWTENFLIKKYDNQGNYIGAYYYPTKNPSLDLDKLDLNRSQRRILSNYDIPETWQAIQTIEVDDENRLWVSVITESDQFFTWWVLKDNGEVLGYFKKEGDRRSISPMSKPLIKIKNNYFYMLERDITEGSQRIVKYSVKFIENR